VADQFRVFRFLTRGEAPAERKLAAITLDAAERYQTRSRVLSALFRWLPIALAFSLIVSSLSGALDGRVEMVVVLLFGALGLVGNLMLNPWTRPTNVARSLKASRGVVRHEHVVHEEPTPETDHLPG
jgi:hypothetical protein